MENILDNDNINQEIVRYINFINEIPLDFKFDNFYDFLYRMKRGIIGKGPYPNVSIFESVNRIMTDLVILFGVKDLLDGRIPELNFKRIKVEYGNENNEIHDIIAKENEKVLIGEAFNVSKSLFRIKKQKSLNKLRKNINDNTSLIIIFNNDAVNEKYKPKLGFNEYYLSINLEKILEEEKYV